MNANVNLARLPLIVFCAEVIDGRLGFSWVEGGLLRTLGAPTSASQWLRTAIHVDSCAAFLAPTAAAQPTMVRLQDGNAQWRWLSLQVDEVVHTGAQLLYQGLLTDASLDKSLMDTAQRYRDYTEISSDWYWEMDAQHRFTYFSREFEEVTGVASSTALGKTRWGGLGRERLGHVDWESHIQMMNEFRPFRNFEYPSRRPDGQIIWFRVSGRPRYDEKGDFLGYYGIASDISATRHIEERLQQSERLASIGQLAAGVAHEINNPIGFVRSNLETLQRYTQELLDLIDQYEALESTGLGSPGLAAVRAKKLAMDLAFMREDAPALLGECRDGLDRVRKIVADLREFCCEGNVEWLESDLRDSVESALNLLAGDALKDITVVRDYAPLPLLCCCPSQLNQVFLALLRNAAAAIAETARPMVNGSRGTLTIRSGHQHPGQQWVEISDNGLGIDPAHLPRLFEPFFTTRAVGKGTGMGLATSFGMVSEHGGRIEVRSTLGEGASFRVLLPVQRTPVGESPNSLKV